MKISLLDRANLFCCVCVEIAIAAMHITERYVHVGMKAAGVTDRIQPIVFGPRLSKRKRSSQLLLLLALALVRGQGRNEGLLRNLNATNHLHALLSLLLLLKEFALTSNVTAVAL